MKVVGYIRVSKESQARDGISLQAQEHKIRVWADLNDYSVVDIYVDAGISGKRTDNREGLQKAIKAIARDDALVVYSLGRLTRSTKDTLELADYLAKNGVDLVSLSENIDTTSAAGRMVFRIFAVLNEFERDQIAERTKMALQHKRLQGYKTGGDVPFGFDSDQTGLLQANTPEQKVISLIKKLREKGYTLRAIGEELMKAGYTTKQGHSIWNPKTISAILKRAI